MEALANISAEVDHLVSSFLAPAMVGNDVVGLTQYTFWMAIAIVLLLVVVFAAKKRLSLVPRGRFINGFEAVVEFVRNDVILGTIGPKADKHAPFLLSLFFFILANNIVGIIPGCKPGTGTIGVTFALALCSFVYFVRVAIKKLGALGYVKSFSPSGVMFPINLVIALIEVFSTFLRMITLAIRLFANMFAGHICLGAFSMMASLCFTFMLDNFSAATMLSSGLPSLIWMVILILIYVIEMAVACIQAYVFTILSSVYIQLSEQDPH